MKRSITIIALALVATGAFAQDLTSKKGEPMLPEAGDWALGIDASPFLNYAGNFFGKSASNGSPTVNFLSTNNAITGKYFTDASTAYRASLRIGFGSNTSRDMVADRSASLTPANYPTVDPMKENVWKHSSTNIGLSGGMEMRKGKTRLQGYYGGELGFFISTSKDKFTYGNALSTSTTNPVDVTNADAFSGAGNINSSLPATGVNGLARATERKNGTTFSFGVRGFIGVEYFILPKISLGGEFGWGLGLSTTGKSTTTYESVGNTSTPGNVKEDSIGNTTVTTSKNGSFGIDTDNTNSFFGSSGTIRLNFHF